MAHSCRWRFPARPGGSSNSGTGRKAGRIRVTASLRNSTGTYPNINGLGPGFDAALQVTAAIDSNLQKFRDVLGESSGSSSGEEEVFGGFGTVSENGRIQSPGWTSTVTPTQEKKPRGRPPRASTVQKLAGVEPKPLPVLTAPPAEKVKRPPGRPPGSGDKRRGRPPASVSQRSWLQTSHVLPEEGRDPALEPCSSPSLCKDVEDDKERKAMKRTPLGPVAQQTTEAKLPRVGCDSRVAKLKRLRDVKLSPLKSGLLKGVPVPVVPRRRRGRPPSAERLKAEATAAAASAAQAAVSSASELSPAEAGAAKQKAFRVRPERDVDPRTAQHLALRASHPADERTSPEPRGSPSTADPATPSKLGRPLGLRQSPRHIKPVRIVPPSKRTDATIAKQLLQRAKKGAQKKKLEAAGSQGGAGIEVGIRRRRRTQLKNIRQFIMPVVSAVSLRIIKTPKRFIEDEANCVVPPPHMKIARLDSSALATAPQPTSPSPTLVSVAPTTTGTVSIPGAGPAVDSLPPPPPPAPAASATVVAAADLLNNNSCNNSNGRFSSSAVSCGSSAVSQHSSQLSSGESSRSSSPSLDDSSCDSQVSDGTQVLSEEPDHSPSSQGEREASLHHAPHPLSPPSEPETEHMLMEQNRHGRRGQGLRRGSLVARGRGSLISDRKKAIISPATGVLMSSSQAGSQQASSTASSSSSPPPPPLLTPPPPPQSASSNAPAISEHHPHSAWIMPHPIAPFLPSPSILPSSHDKRRAILREPTFRWTSLSRTEQHYFSSAKYAKEGLIRKPIFDNFRPPPLTAEDVGLMPPGPGGGGVAPGGFPASGGAGGASTRLFSPHHHHHHQHPSSRFEPPVQKRSPLLRAPRFTPSAAHSRIFESVTLPPSSGSSPGSLSPLQATSPSNRMLRRRKRRQVGLSRGQPRSPSHSMTTRSGQSGAQAGKSSSDLSALTSSVPTSVTGNSSPLPGVAVSPIAPSALTQAPFNTFSSSSLVPISHGASDGRRVDGCLGVGGSSASSSSQLFPRFASSPQGPSAGKAGRERSASASRDALPKEKERDALPKEKEREPEKSREREKENKREAKKDWERRGKSHSSDGPTSSNAGLFTVDVKDAEESFTQKKTPVQKKSVAVDSSAEASLGETSVVQPLVALLSKGRLSKKGRLSEKDVEADAVEKEKERASVNIQSGNNPPTTASLGSMLAHAEKQPVTDRRVAGLLKKAKAQLYKIEKNKSMKSADQSKGQGQESDSSETSVRGPRIKHVCRRAAVALGRNRAVFPDDMPTLSALPWEEKEKILSSMGNDDKSSVAGSEEAEPSTPPIKPVTRHKTLQEAPPRKGRRSRRCGQCSGCQVPEDCGDCTNCLDKPKFGGRNIKKQCCKMRKCQNLQWMPSKMFLQKQTKGKKDKKKNKLSEKKDAHHSIKSQYPEVSSKPAPPTSKEGPPTKKSETPPPVQGEDKQKQQRPPSPPSPGSSSADPPLIPSPDNPRQAWAPPSSASRKERKPQQTSPSSSSSPVAPSTPPVHSQQHVQHQSQVSAKKEPPAKSPPSEPKKKSHQRGETSANVPSASEVNQTKKQTAHCDPSLKLKLKKEKQMATKPDRSTLNFLSTPSTGGTAKQKAPCDGVHRIRVDFKEDCDIEKVWNMGGLSILTSVPITPRVVCFLCASSGNVEFVFCQVCCEPFHLFCLGETERPHSEDRENWCCRRCRFCHTCGRQHKETKQLLQCDKCRNCFHPECLGPNHPTRPTKKRIWICTKCVRCKSCGTTKPGKARDAQWSHDLSLCHDCAKLFAKGNFCPVCDKCFDEDESKMMQCAKCRRWIHAQCERVTDEMHELLSSLSGSVSYTCTSCTECRPSTWRSSLEKEIQRSVRQVLTALLNSRTSTHLLRYRQAVMKPPELNPETEESLPSRRSPEGPDPPVLTEVSVPSDSPPDLESVEKKMDSGRYKSVMEFSDDVVRIIQAAINSEGGQPESRKANGMVKSFFIRQMEQVFPWFKVRESKFWEIHKVSSNSGLLPNAVLPPSLDHNYAQWQERDERARAEQPQFMKIIPAPHPKAPGEPDFPPVPPPPPPPPQPVHDSSWEGSPDHPPPPPPGVGDNRQCVLCLSYGDEKTNDCGRLLYIGENEWTHVNCALWSAEVFEDDDGSLKNVHTAVSRGRQLRCEMCQRPGATVGCDFTSCPSNYHFMCARQGNCVFLEDRKVYCQRHRDLIKGEVVADTGFEVTRRVLVDFEGISLRRKFTGGLEPDNVHMMIGSMTIDCLGMLTELSDCERKLFPVGYQCSRVYWSTLDARKRCVYTCRILACRPLVADTVSNGMSTTEHNHTIAHSPPPLSEMNPSPLPVSVDHTAIPITPKPRVYFRNRHPSYPPCHRSPSSKPLPSPGGVTSSSHEIVTVGDPLLSSALPCIGSRRHSTSSLPTQQPGQRISFFPQRSSIMNQKGSPLSASTTTSASHDRGVRDSVKGKVSGGERSQCQAASTVTTGPQCRLGYGFNERMDGGRDVARKQSEGESLKSAPPGVLAGVSQVSPPLGTAVLTGHQRGSGSLRTEKGKQATKDTDLPPGVTLLPCHPLAPLAKDKALTAVKEGSLTTVPESKDIGKTGSPQPLYHKSGGRKSNECVSGPSPAAAIKPLWSIGMKTGEEDIKRGSQASPSITTVHGTSSTKEKRSKVKLTVARDIAKERKDMPQNSKTQMLNSNSKGSNIKMHGQLPSSQNNTHRATGLSSNKASGTAEIKSDNQRSERALKSGERIGTEKKHSPAAEMVQPKAGSERTLRPPQVHPKSSKEAAPVEKKRTEKLSLITQKMDPNGTKAVTTCSDTNTSTSITAVSHGPQRRSSRAMMFSPSASSESSESDSHNHPEDCEEHLMDHHLAEDDGDGEDHHLEDEALADKQHEEDSDGSAGSAKRRYPRRSARARSNMFFGLTPFYGVRSYGEEDIPFYSSGDIPLRKRSSSSKRSAEGQVDGADDMSTSSSADSGEDEEGGFGPNKDAYYYNFTRTIINPSSSLPSIEGIDQCLGRGSQIHRFLRDGAKESHSESDDLTAKNKNLEFQPIGQLDGVDDGSESDASVNTSSTTTATTSSTLKTSNKKRSRDGRVEKLNISTGKDTTGGGSSHSRDGRKSHKDNCLPLGSVKSQGQDPLETQLSLSTDLLKSDSDNNNSDDCGNILPSDIMEFVLNTPSMQTLGQQSETPSSEPFSLDEGYGVDVNQRKDILFEDFTQPLSSTEPVEGGVNTSITVEEPYVLPLELPSDLSVLTTRSPSVNNQNHGSLITESSERTILTLGAEDSGVEKSGEKQRAVGAVSSESPRDTGGDSQVTEGHMTPEHFIPARIDGDHISSPGITQVAEAGNQDLARTSRTPGLPSSPTLALPGQKFIPAATVSTGPSQIASSAVQSTTSHLKPGPDKLIVFNQHLQPLYVLQTLPNGVTQKIQIAPSVTATGVMNSSTPVLTGLNAGISTSQSIFPAGGKGLVPVHHHSQLHAFTTTTQTGFQPVIPSTTSGLLIGVPSHDPQIIASEAGHRHDLAPSVAMVSSASSISPTPAVLSTAHGKKRPISRIQPRKIKKLARSRSQPTLAPSEVGPNMTLINLSSPQIAAGIPAQPGLVATAAATSHRKMPNIIKRSKSGVMYLEPTLLPQPMPISTSAQPSLLGHDSSTHLLPCTVSGLNPNQSVLNVVSMPPTAPGNLLGANPVSLSTPGLISSTEITGPLSNLLFKASPHNLGLPEQQMVLHSGTPMMSQIANPAQTSIASNICVLPPNQTISMSVSQQVDKEGNLHLQNPVSRVVSDKAIDPSTNASGQVALAASPITQDLNKGHVVGVLTQSSRTTPISRPSNQQQALKPSTVAFCTVIGKGKQKAKRTLPSLDKSGGKKHKGLHPETLPEPQGPPGSADQSSLAGPREHVTSEPMETGKPNEKGLRKSDSVTRTCESTLKQKAVEPHDEKPKLTGLSGQSSGKESSTMLTAAPDQKDNGQDASSDFKPKQGLLFEICSDDGFKIRCESIEEAWKSLTDKVQEARSNAKLKELSFDGVNGLRMLGVVHDAVVFLLEQLCGARYCRNHRFRFHKPEEVDELPINPHGSARSEVHHRRSVLDMFNFLASKHRQAPEYNPQEDDEEEMQLKSARRATSMDSPLAVRLRHLKKTSKESLGVYRSAIHGRGLFCKRNIDAGEMVIEYSGNVIRSVLTDKREKYYDAKGIGCYMFRIDDYEVVDATVHGNAARFINHSCEPNCYSRVVNIDGKKHIVIFAMRKIYRGEELTYDYKFPIEEPGNKLPCNCGAKKCRKFLN